MEVLLVNPPNTYRKSDDFYVTFPLGIAYLAAYLEKFGHNVSIIDSLIEDNKLRWHSEDVYSVGLANSELIQRIRDMRPDIIGISCSYTVQYPSSRGIANAFKANLNIPIVIGGAHPSAVPREVLEDGVFDFVVMGEGEETLLELVNCLENKKAFDNVAGIAYKQNGEVKVNPRKFIPDIDKIPFPARHLLPIDKYSWTNHSHNGFTKRKPYMTMITSRGCPLDCIFCSIHSVWGFTWRGRKPETVVDEIEHLYKQYGIREIHFEDDMLTLNKKRMLSICDEIISRGLDITWTTPNGVYVNSLDEELLVRMKESGCYQLALAIESGKQNVLKNLMRKRLSLSKARQVVKIMRRLEMGVYLFFVIGIPGETREDIIDTITFAKELAPDEAYFSIATPYPGTELYKICLEKGYIDVENLDLTRLKPTNAVIETEHLCRKELEDLRDFAYAEWHASKSKNGKSAGEPLEETTAISRRLDRLV